MLVLDLLRGLGSEPRIPKNSRPGRGNRDEGTAEKMRLEMLVRMQVEILDDRSTGLYSNEPLEKTLAMTIKDVVCIPRDLFESHLPMTI